MARAKARSAKPPTVSAESVATTQFYYGWRKAEDDHIDIDERQVRIRIEFLVEPPENFKAASIEVHFDLSQVPETVVVYTDDHPDPLPEKYSISLGDDEIRWDAQPDDRTRSLTLLIATGAFAAWKRGEKDPNPYNLPAAKGDETFEIKVSGFVCRTIPVNTDLQWGRIMDGRPISIEVRDGCHHDQPPITA